MVDGIHVRVPCRQLVDELPFLVAHRLNPEIAIQGDDLDQSSDIDFRSVGDQLRSAGLSVTVHAPFHDLNPGAMDCKVREITFDRCRRAIDAAGFLGARVAVFHPGFDHWKYGGQDHLWLDASRQFWPPLLEIAKDIGCLIALENIFEQHPRLLATLIADLNSPYLGHCFDIGHWHLFASVSLKEWFDLIGPHLRHLHLHDNFGLRDDHLPPGAGQINFSSLFTLISNLPHRPSVTLEVNGREAQLSALSRLSSFLSH